MTEKMSKGERDMLLSLVKKRESVMRSMAAQRSAELLAQFEADISKQHQWFKDDVWTAAVKEAEATVKSAQDKVQQRCEELGIPEEFRPSLNWHWSERGENMWDQRRAELRRSAKAEIEAMEATALTQIGAMAVEAQTSIIKEGIQTETAMKFLEDMAPIQTLMPLLEFGKIATRADDKKRLSWN